MYGKRVFGENFWWNAERYERRLFVNAACVVCREDIPEQTPVIVGTWNRKDGWQHKAAHAHIACGEGIEVRGFFRRATV